MKPPNRSGPRTAVLAILATMGIASAWIVLSGETQEPGRDVVTLGIFRRPSGHPQLVSINPLPEMEGAMCQWVPASTQTLLVAALRQERLAARAAAPADLPAASVTVDRAPARVIRDPYPTYSAVAVDPLRNEIVLQDENLFQIMVYDRTANTPPTAAMTEPKRVISGPNTEVEFNCGLYVDPKTGDIYSVNNDTLDAMTVFSRNARGNVHPDRELHTPHRTFGIAVDEKAEELYLTVQHPPAVIVYRKMAKGEDSPLRILEGPRTGLEDPHGIALDTKNGLMYVSNHGAVSYSKDGKNFTRNVTASAEWRVPNEAERRRNMIPGSGEYGPPSITVYSMKATGDMAPLRVMEGPNTQLNWPAQMHFDEDHGELFVANDVGDSILVFRGADSGNATPIRVLKGSKTGIKNPTGVSLDTPNQELVVSNMGNHTATVYSRTATGDTPPLRTIRSGPLGKIALAIGNPGAVSYDSKREEILVPN